MNAADAKVLGIVYTLLLTYGACSLERILKESNLNRISAQWAFFQLRCQESGGLFTLPDAMLPSGWDGDIQGDDPDPCNNSACTIC
jgi:hypothetical protein